MSLLHRNEDNPEHPNRQPQSADAQPDITDLYVVPDVTPAERRRWSLKKKVGVGIAALATIAGGSLFVLKKGPSNNKNDSLANSSDSPTTVTNPIEIASGNSAETLHNYGNIDITRILPTDRTAVLPIPTGEIIHVPFLRSPDGDPNLFGESVLAEFACYLTTGNESCVPAFSVSAIEQLHKARNAVVLLIQSKPIDSETQFVLFDPPNNPAFFSRSSDARGNTYIELLPNVGKLFARLWKGIDGHSGWQNAYSRIYDARPFIPTPEWVFSQFRITVGKQPDGSPTVTHLDIGMQVNPDFHWQTTQP